MFLKPDSVNGGGLTEPLSCQRLLVSCPERCDCSIVMLKDWGNFRRSVPGFDARRGRVVGTAENTGLICILSSGRAASRSNLTGAVRRWETEGGRAGELVARRRNKETQRERRKESPNFNNKEKVFLHHTFAHTL